MLLPDLDLVKTAAKDASVRHEKVQTREKHGGREGGREGYGRPRERTEPSGFDAICMVLGDLHGVLHVFR